MHRHVGIDFGTTNTALAVCDGDGAPRLATYDTPAGRQPTFRSVLFFTSDSDGPTRVLAGPDGIAAYVAGNQGRLLQSLKSYLADPNFRSTNVYGRIYRIEEVLGAMLRRVRQQAEKELGDLSDATVVAGRPVHFVGSRGPEENEIATARLRRGLELAGFRHVQFLEEPVAAAYDYRQRLAREEIALIADFGGGTTDLSLVRLSPAAVRRGGVEIIATAGVGLAGDAFDGRIIAEVVAPELGANDVFHSIFGQEMPVPAWLFTHLRRWHHVSFLKSRKTVDMLNEIIRTATPSDRLKGLLHLIEEDLGFALHDAVQATKQTLSTQPASGFVFRDGPLEIACEVERPAFSSWIAPELEKIATAIGEVMAAAGTLTVDTVFLTGGSALVPAVRRLFGDRFGDDRLRGGGELTTVANGLARAAVEASHD